MPSSRVNARSNPGETPGILLWRTANAWQRAVRDRLKDQGLTQAQFTLLHTLSSLAVAAPEGTNQRQLADLCGMDVTMVSTVLRQLQRDGLVARRAADDARSRINTLTAAGHTKVAAAAPGVQAVDTAFFAALRQDQAAFAGALRLLLGMRLRVSARSAPARSVRSTPA